MVERIIRLYMEHSLLQQLQRNKNLHSVKDIFRRTTTSLRNVYNMSELDHVNSSSISWIKKWPDQFSYCFYTGFLICITKPFHTSSHPFYASEKKFMVKKMHAKAFRFGVY